MTEEIEGQMTFADLDIWSGKTSQAHFQATTEKTSRQSSRKSSGSQSRTPLMCLCLKRESGPKQDASTMNWQTGAWPGGLTIVNGGASLRGEKESACWLTSQDLQHQRLCLTLNTGEQPRTANPSKLSQILEQNPDSRYNLSAKACQRILNRAARRGKKLPEALEMALRMQSASKNEPGNRGGGKGILIQDEHVGALSTLNNQSVFCIQGGGVTSQNSQGGGINEDVSFTVNALDRHAVAYSFDSLSSNSMKSKNPYSGCREVEVAKTIDCFDPNPAKNQGGMAIIQPIVHGFNRERCGAVVSEEVMPTLQAVAGESGNNKPMVYDGSRRHNYEPLGDVCETVQASYGTGGGNTPIVMEPTVYNGENITSPINKTNPQPGDPCHTLSADSGNCVVEPICVEMTSTKNTVVEDGVSPTLTARMGTGGNQVNAVCMSMETYHCTLEEEKVQTLKAKDYKDPPITYQDTTGALMASGYAKNGTQEAANDMYVVSAVDCRNSTEDCVNGTLQNTSFKNLNSNSVCRQDNVVRRLTPKECERLQSFPDDWTNIGEWVDSKGKRHKDADSPRYKALGNSIALPFWFWLLRRISAQYERPATLGSLFDGIGGFPYCWEKCNGKGSAIWASEIEEFPIAVTKLRFPEREENE